MMCEQLSLKKSQIVFTLIKRICVHHILTSATCPPHHSKCNTHTSQTAASNQTAAGK